MSGQRYVLRVPLALKEKIEQAARAEDKLPTEWLRDVARAALESRPGIEAPGSDGEDG